MVRVAPYSSARSGEGRGGHLLLPTLGLFHLNRRPYPFETDIFSDCGRKLL